MLRSRVGVELLWVIVRHKNYDAINRAELRHHMAIKFPDLRASNNATGNRSTRYLGAALRQLERAGVLRRRTSPNGDYVDLLNVGKAEVMLRKLLKTVPTGKPQQKEDEQ